MQGKATCLGDSPRDPTTPLQHPKHGSRHPQNKKVLAVGVLEPKMATETMHWGNDTIRSLLVSTVPHHSPAFLFPSSGRANAHGLPPFYGIQAPLKGNEP